MVFFLFIALGAMAQEQATTSQKKQILSKVDSLPLPARVSLRTNAVDWVLMLPNIGIEYDINPYNWNRWAVNLNLKGNWNTSHTYKPGLVYNMFEARVEARNYWRTRLIKDHIKPHKHIWEKALSQRRFEQKHPKTVYYRGAYLSYTSYSVKIGSEGKQGSGIILGGTYGIVRSMYEFKSGNTLDLEFGVAAGFLFHKYDTYIHDVEDNCYPITSRHDWGLNMLPVVSDLRVGLVYRFGSYPLQKKYQWRYDVDFAYQEKFDLMQDSIAQKNYNDSVFKANFDAVNKEFWRIYDTEAAKNKKTLPLDRARQSDMKKAQKAADAAKKKAAKEAEKAEKEAAKAAEKAAKEAEKKAAQKSEEPAAEKAEEPEAKAEEPEKKENDEKKDEE